MWSRTAGSDVLMPGTAMRSRSVKSFSVFTCGLRVIRYIDDELMLDSARTCRAGLSFVFAHSVRNPGTPMPAMSSAPASIASLITLPPSNVFHSTLTSGSPAAFARFSISCSRSMTINGRYRIP